MSSKFNSIIMQGSVNCESASELERPKHKLERFKVKIVYVGGVLEEGDKKWTLESKKHIALKLKKCFILSTFFATPILLFKFIHLWCKFPFWLDFMFLIDSFLDLFCEIFCLSVTQLLVTNRVNIFNLVSLIGYYHFFIQLLYLIIWCILKFGICNKHSISYLSV